MNLKLEKFPICALFFSILSYLIFAPSLFFPIFIFDDHFHIFQNPFVLNPNFQNFFQIWAESRTPIIFNLWQLIALAFGTDSPVPFRAINILVHGLNASLVFKIATFFMKEKSAEYQKLASWGTTLIFLVHPLQSESIIWISSFKGTASAFMALLSLYFVLKSNRLSQETKEEDPMGILTLILFTLGLLIKPTIAPMAIVLPLVDYFHNHSTFQSIIKKYAATMLTAVLVGIVFQKQLLTTDYQVITLFQKFQIMLFSFFFYTKSILFPFDLAFSYNLNPFEILKLLSSTKHLLMVITFYTVLILFITILIRKTINRRLILLTSSCFFLLLIPTTGIIPFDFQNISTVANRYTYLPLVFLCLFFFIFVDELVKHEWLKKLVVFFVLILAVLNFNQIRLWANNETILLSGQNPNDIPLHILLPLAQAKILEKDEEGARKYSEQAFARSPENSVSLVVRRTFLSAEPQDYLNTTLLLESNPRYLSYVDLFDVGRLYERLNLFILADRFYQRNGLLLKTPADRQKLDEHLSRKKDIYVMMTYAGMIQLYLSREDWSKAEALFEEFEALNLPPEYHHFIDQFSSWFR